MKVEHFLREEVPCPPVHLPELVLVTSQPMIEDFASRRVHLVQRGRVFLYIWIDVSQAPWIDVALRVEAVEDVPHLWVRQATRERATHTQAVSEASQMASVVVAYGGELWVQLLQTRYEQVPLHTRLRSHELDGIRHKAFVCHRNK